MGPLGLLYLLIFLGESWGQEQRQIISAPKVFRVGASENVVIQVYGYTEAFNATICVKSYPDKKFQYSSSHISLSPDNKFQNSAILSIPPKQLHEGQHQASYVYLDIISKHFSKSKKVPVIYDNRFFFIYTDKLVYTPGQSVKVKVYPLSDDLKPAKRETVLTFIDPEGVEVDTVEENDTEILSFPDFKIPSNPKYGVWTIQAKYKDFSKTGSTYFEIKEYDESFKKVVRQRRTLRSKIEEKAANYKHPIPKKCCFDGAFLNDESCENRAARINIGPKCVSAFIECCTLANKIRAEHKRIWLCISHAS